MNPLLSWHMTEQAWSAFGRILVDRHVDCEPSSVGAARLGCARGGRQSAPGASWVQLGLVVDVLDDGLTQLGFGHALLHAGQRVADYVAGRESRAFKPGLRGQPGEPLPLFLGQIDRPVVGV